MNANIDSRRIYVFLGFAFGIAWLVGLVVFLTGGLIESPVVVPGTPITLALVAIALGYMWSPGIAHVLTRVVTREGWEGTYLRPQLRIGWPYWIAAWFIPVILSISGAFLFFLFLPQYFDPTMANVRETFPPGELPSIPLWLLVAINTLIAVLVSPVINTFFTFGEEFGWRAYLQPKLLPLGSRRAILLLGVIWGIWHWPVIAMGHNYGLDYPGYPWSGMLMMVWFTLVAGIFLGWVTMRGGSVWPAAIGHAAINGIAGWGMLFAIGEPPTLLGPTPVGFIAAIPWTLLAVILLIHPTALRSPEK
jgi:uncharacterized protein